MITIAVEECSGANRCIPFPSLSQRGKETMHALQLPRLRRAGALAIATAITSTTLIAAATPAQAHPAGDRAVSSGSTWLKAQLTDGILHNEEYEYDDLGLSADVAFALDAVGGQGPTVTQIVDAIEPDAESWVGGSTPTRVYAGSLAKMVSVVQAADQDPRSYNGIDQVSRLEGLVSSSASVAGRLEDAGVVVNDPWDADYVNVIGQSFAARALRTAASSRALDATMFLLDQQCSDGFFRASLTAHQASRGQGCVDGIDSGSIDTTALAVINILDTPGASTRAKGAAALAATWLKGQQATDGSFTAGGAEGYNANTTGLAGWALAEAGHDGAATRAAAWLRGLQVADLAPCTTALTAENGAILFKAQDVTSSRAALALDVPTRERARRASAQALPALANVPAGAATAVSAPATAVEKGTVTVTVSGLGAGEPGCVSFGAQARPVTGTGAPVTVTFDLPAGAATHTFRLTTLAGSSTATTAASATPTPTPVPTPAPVPQVGTLDVPRVVTVEGRKFRLSLTCEGTVVCAGKVKVKTARKVELRSGKRLLTLAKRSYSLTPGGEKELVLTLTKPGRKLLSDGKVKVKAVQTTPGAERSVTKFWLKAARG